MTYSETLENVSFGAARQQDSREVSTPGTTLVFDALGQHFEIELEPNTRLVRGQLPAGIGIYRGEIVGKSDSWARITMANGVPTGLIWDGNEMLAIDAASIYRLKDTYVEAGSMSCGVSRDRAKETTLATAYATVLMGDEIATNIFMLGYAWQLGLVPLHFESINT